MTPRERIQAAAMVLVLLAAIVGLLYRAHLADQAVLRCLDDVTCHRELMGR